MLPYFILITVVGLFLISSRVTQYNFLYYSAGIFLIIYSGIREGVGVDYFSYSDIFLEIKNGMNANEFEPFNMAIINFSQLIGMGENLIFTTYSIITIIGVLYFCKNLSNNKEVSLFIFAAISIFYLSTFNLVRQWAAISMMLFAITSLINQKKYRVVTFITFACMFHFSAMVLVIIPFLKIRFSKKAVLIIFLLGVLLSGFSLLIIEQLPYARYLNDSFKSDRSISLLFFSTYVIALFLPIFYVGYFNDKKIITNKEVMLINMNLLSILILIIGLVLNIDFQSLMRLNIYFSIQLIILIPMMLSKLNISIRKIIYPIFIISITIFYGYIIAFKGEEYMLTPYNSILM